MFSQVTAPKETLAKDKFVLGLAALGYNLGAAGLMTYLMKFYTDYNVYGN